MGVSYLDKVLYLYSDIQHVMQWHTDNAGNELGYEGLVWNNTEIAKPTKAELDALDDAAVELELQARAKANERALVLENAKNDYALLSNFDTYRTAQGSSDISLSSYLDYLDTVAAEVSSSSQG